VINCLSVSQLPLTGSLLCGIWSCLGSFFTEETSSTAGLDDCTSLPVETKQYYTSQSPELLRLGTTTGDITYSQT